MSYYKFIAGIKWYYCLKSKEDTKALFTDYPRNTLSNKFLTCWDFGDNDKKIKLYSVFKDYLEFAKFFLKLPQNLRCFYEIVLGDSLQKPKFDLDMELTDKVIQDEVVLNDLINSIVSVLSEKDIQLNLEKDICIYSSHGETKKSYHIVINSYCHTNNIEAKAFYFTVMEKMPQYQNEKWIDRAVYSKTQQFRTYKSSKAGSNRIKELVKTWKYNGEVINHLSNELPEDEDHDFLINFEESLINARVSNCKVLPTFQVEEKSDYQTGEDLEYDLAMEALALLASKVGKVPEDKSLPYRFDRIEGPFVVLKRVKASKCRICSRIHYNQNPYLFIVPETKHVYFDCRRSASNKKWYLGCLGPEDEKGEVIDNIKDIKVEWSMNKIQELNRLAATSVKLKKKEIKEIDQKMNQKIVNDLKNKR